MPVWRNPRNIYIIQWVEKWSQPPVNILFNKLCPERDPMGMSSHISLQNLKCTLPRTLGHLSFISITAFRIMNFILSVSQMAELRVGPPGFAFPLLTLSLQTNCLVQTQPPPHSPRALWEMLHIGTPHSSSPLYLSIIVSLTYTQIHNYFLPPCSFTVRHLRVLCLLSTALTPPALMSQRRHTLEPHREVDWVNCKTLSRSHPICLLYTCHS